MSDEKRTFHMQKKFTQGVKLSTGSTTFFSTELSTTVEVSCPDDLIAASDKLFAQAKFLVERDITSVFPSEQGTEY